MSVYYRAPDFLAELVDQIVKDYIKKEVKPKKLWSEVDKKKPFDADFVTAEMRSGFKKQYGSGLELEQKDTFWGRTFTLLVTDTMGQEKRLVLGVLQDETKFFKAPVDSQNTTGKQSIVGRWGTKPKDFVLDGLGQFIPRFVYRCVNNVDVVNLNTKSVFAILAKNIKAGNSILEHVGGQPNTKYISTTRSRHEIQNAHGETFDKGKSVKIDLSYVDSARIFDLSTPKGEAELLKFMSQKVGKLSGQNQQALEDVKRTKEVLIEKIIPGDAIVATRGFKLSNVEQIKDNADF